MKFWIQVSAPSLLKIQERFGSETTESIQVSDLAEAIQTIFPVDTEDAWIVWHGIGLRLSYKYDLSIIIDDLLPMLNTILENSSGTYIAAFASDTFGATWKLDWSDDFLAVSAGWGMVRSDIFSLPDVLELRTDEFIYEWKMLLQKLIIAVDESKIRIENISEYNQLKEIFFKIKQYGRLYRCTEITDL